MKSVDKELLKKAGEDRFISHYHYAVYEYYRSTKIIKELETEKIRYSGIVLDNGCGSGGITASFAEEARLSVGIDIEPRFFNAATRLVREKKIRRTEFIQTDGCSLPFKNNSFDLVISHSVIEHTINPVIYLNEAYRVLKAGGTLFLETPPYYSFEGTHLPKPALPFPFQFFLPRRLLFRLYLFIGRRKPTFFRGGANGSALLTSVSRGEVPKLEHLEKMKIGKLRRMIKKTGFIIVKEKLYNPPSLDKALPSSILNLFKKCPLTRDFIVNTYKIFLQKPIMS